MYLPNDCQIKLFPQFQTGLPSCLRLWFRVERSLSGNENQNCLVVFSDFGLIFSTKSSQSSCVCVQGYNRTEYSVSVETGSIHTCSQRFPRMCSVCTGGGINLASLMVLWGEMRRLISLKWFAHKEASVTAGLSLFYEENKPHLKLVFLSKQLTQYEKWFILKWLFVQTDSLFNNNNNLQSLNSM